MLGISILARKHMGGDGFAASGLDSMPVYSTRRRIYGIAGEGLVIPEVLSMYVPRIFITFASIVMHLFPVSKISCGFACHFRLFDKSNARTSCACYECRSSYAKSSTSLLAFFPQRHLQTTHDNLLYYCNLMSKDATIIQAEQELAAPIERGSHSRNPSRDEHRQHQQKQQQQQQQQSSPIQHRDASSGEHKLHGARPSQDLAAHERLVRKDSRARRTIPRDQIDDLDNILGSYHHEGPFDATLASRQIPGRAPVEAVTYGNSLALSATPSGSLRHSLALHEPLDGTSRHASGTTVAGQRFDYDEENMEGQEDKPDARTHGRRRRGVGDEDGDDDDTFSDGLGGSAGAKHGKGDLIEMQGSSRGVVEYSHELDDEVLDDYGQPINTTSGSSSSSRGVLGGLKKRLSVKRH